ncbi:MAG TPA: carbohydrate kinase family protein [Thermomicrobiales bacterium]|nr:carbohydrate kinase family protein [Thermomicrobiales bacterium]
MTAPVAIVGNLNVDLWVRPVARFPQSDEEIVVDSARLELAGTAGYMLHACRALGIPAVTVSTIGDDAFGAAVVREMERLGASLAGVETLPGEETSVGIVFVAPDGARGLLSTLGAHREMSVAIARRHDAAVAACREVILCGNYLLPQFGPADVVDYARKARSRGQTIFFDPSWDPAGWTARTRDKTFALLQTVDCYLPNEAEVLHLTGRNDLAAAIAEVAALAGDVVVKRGADGAIWARGDKRVAVPAFAVDAVNTIGAGDIFDIGYLYGRRQEWPPTRRLQFAGALAALVIRQPGARTYPSAAAVFAFLHDRTGDAAWAIPPTTNESAAERRR